MRKFLSADQNETGGGGQAVTDAKRTLIGQVAAEQIIEWHKKYVNGIYALEVDGHIMYFSKPTRDEMNYLLSNIDEERTYDMFDDFIGMTCIGGSDAYQTDDDIFFGLCRQLQKVMAGKKASLVNLGMKRNEPYEGEVDEAQLAAWQAANPKGIYAIEVGGCIVYFRKPNRKDMNAAMAKAEVTYDMYSEFAALTKLGGSEAPFENDELFIGLCRQLKKVMDGKKASIVKL